ncbi:MAG: tetratricopeptide repeat protein [Solidesulfovibrio sp. DCME]|uniref:tetratricopeptide repeat protein n=1 Tax=Solidesulfovibrio sp. DCME TaxID=3447380 RepID=UPI003D0D69EC
MSNNIARVRAEQAAKRYERIVIDYFAEGGMAVAATDDESFSRLVKFTLGGLRVDVKAAFRETADYDELVAFANKVCQRVSAPLLLFIERRIRKATCIKPVKVLKTFYGDRVRLIVAGTEMSRDELVLTHEIGADSCITKPISANALVEKMAFAVKPNNQLGVLLDRAAELIAAGDLDQAERVTAKAFEIKPDSLKCHLLMGDASRKRGDFAAAEKHYLAAAKAEKLYIEPLQRLVGLCQEAGEFDRRLAYLTRLDTLSPLNFERKVEIGGLHLAKGDSDTARTYFEEARRVVTRVASDMVSDSLMEIVRVIGEKDQEMALRFVTEAIAAKGEALGQGDLWLFNDRGILLRRQGLWAQAVDNYRKALEIAPDDPGILYNIGVAHAEGKQFDIALQHFERALAVEPNLARQAPSVAYNIATAHHRCRNLDQARAFLGIALELDPGYEAARRMLDYLTE